MLEDITGCLLLIPWYTLVFMYIIYMSISFFPVLGSLHIWHYNADNSIYKCDCTQDTLAICGPEQLYTALALWTLKRPGPYWGTVLSNVVSLSGNTQQFRKGSGCSTLIENS